MSRTAFASHLSRKLILETVLKFETTAIVVDAVRESAIDRLRSATVVRAGAGVARAAKVAFVALALLCAGGAAVAQPITKSLAELGAGREPLRLNTWQAAYSVKLPVSPREVVTGAMLRLDTVNSTALIKSRSEMQVRINGRILAQYPLDPENTRHSRDIALPVGSLKAGYNDLSVSVVQHYTYECEDPSSPELWTEIDPIRSAVTFNFDGVKPNLNPKLTQLHVAFDQRSWLQRPLAVVSGTERISEPQLAAASLVTQGLALRMGYRPVKVDVFNAHTAQALRPGHGHFPGLAPQVAEGRDVVLVGKRAELSRYLDSELYGLIAGSFVGVFSADGGKSVVLVVSGTTDEELMQAARSVADSGFKFSEVALETITRSFAFDEKPLAAPNSAQQFSKFGYRTQSSRGLKIQPITLEFRAPADYGARKGDMVGLRLHFSYGAGLRKDSSMTVKLNGQFAIAVPLNEESGGEFEKYDVRVPAQFIRPGFNTLVFEPVFLAHKGKCDMLRDEHLVLTIYEDSTLELPRPTVSPKVPDLERLSAGFWPLQDHMRMYLTDTDVHTAGAALSFVGMVAQKNRAPFEVEVRYSPFETGHMMVIGPDSGLADFVRNALPLKRYKWTAAGNQAGLLQAAEGKRVITALTARDAETIKAAVTSLNEKGLWQGISGAAAVIDTLEHTVANEPAESTVELGLRDRAAANVTDWRWLAGAALGLSVLFAIAFVSVLRRRARHRTDTSEG
jgi:cellulose synthase operon protein B